jgi:L-2-hydroxyglutarate oxidase
MYDFAIIGGGIVGLATAMSLGEKYPDSKVLVLEKELDWGHHQTGHNSGVIHSGIYYKPGSLKAKLCREGCASMAEFCESNEIDYEVCGKLIVATEAEELERLEFLYHRGLANGIKVEKLSPEAAREIEPYVNCIAAIRVYSTGIVDYKQVCKAYVNCIQRQGGELKLNAKVTSIRKETNRYFLHTHLGSFQARFLINCAGLHSDRIAHTLGDKPEAKIIPFRGEYYELVPEKRYLVKGLIYPVPNPNFPFLGVHLTRMIDGSVHAGPNAVLSLKREGYSKFDFDFRDFAEVVTYPGFWKLATKYWNEGLQEIVRSFSKKAFLKSLQRLIPDIESDDLIISPPGVRAQALAPTGNLVDDFLLIQKERIIHVCNAPSPAATSSIEIGKYISEKVFVK